MLVRPLSLLNKSAAVYIEFLHIFHITSGRKKHRKNKLFVANFIYDIHIFIDYFQCHLRTFNNFVMCTIFVVSYIWIFYLCWIDIKVVHFYKYI